MTTGFRLRAFLQRFGLIISFVLLSLVLTLLSDRFLTLANVINILRQSIIDARRGSKSVTSCLSDRRPRHVWQCHQ